MYTRHWIMLGLVLAVSWPMAAAAGPAEDKAKANQIAHEIRDSGRLTNFRVGVKFEEGVAVLLGNVTDRSQAAAATEVAKQVAGVDRVVNKLKLTNAKPSKPAGTTNALHFEEAASAPAQGEDAGLLLTIGSETSEPAPVKQASQKLAETPKLKPTSTPQLKRVARAPVRQQRQNVASRGLPRPIAWGQQPGRPPVQTVGYAGGGARPAGYHPGGGQATPAGYSSPNLPGYAWPSYAASQNYAALTYPRQYSPTAWPYIGPFYPYPQVPLGWRKVALEWDDGWWFLDFSHHQTH